MLSLTRRAVLSLSRWQQMAGLQYRSYEASKRRKMRTDYEISMDFSWAKPDVSGQVAELNYLTDHTKTPDQVIAGLSDFDRQRMRDIGNQIDVQAALGKYRVPDRAKMTSFDWIHLLSCKSANALGRKMFYIATKQLSENQEIERKAQRSLARHEREVAKDGVKQFKFDSIHHRIMVAEMKTFYDMRLAHEYEYCPSLVFDMSFDECMNTKSLVDLCNQLKHIFHSNREHVEPFQLHFCNLRRNTQQYYFMHRNLGATDHDSEDNYVRDQMIVRSMGDIWPYTFTDACYTSLFPAKDLVYMSPNGRQELREYDPTKVYIIGGMVDLGGNQVGVTKSKSASQGIPSMRLPRGVSPRCLPLNVFYDLMQSLRLIGSWLTAKSLLPKRMQQSAQQQVGPRAKQSLLYGGDTGGGNASGLTWSKLGR